MNRLKINISLNEHFSLFSPTQASSETTFARESVLSSDEESLEPLKKYRRLQQQQEEIDEIQLNFKQQQFEIEGVDLNLKDSFDEDVDMVQSQDSQGSFSVNEVTLIYKSSLKMQKGITWF